MPVGPVLFVLLFTAAALAGPHGPRLVGGRRSVPPRAVAGTDPDGVCTRSSPTETRAAAPDAFTTTVRPILATRCAPCHNPGGQMYGRMPFDDPKVVSSHSQGILRRMKGDDREAMVRWLSGLAPSDGAR